MHELGLTRSVRRLTHALHTPDAFIRSPLPGMERATAIVHASPALGAGFTWYTAELEPGGQLGDTAVQRFVYVLDGHVDLRSGAGVRGLHAGEFAYLPPGEVHHLSASYAETPARLAVIEKPYMPLEGASRPKALLGTETAVAGQALGGDPDLMVRPLLPDEPGFDFAVNTMTYQPGASLAQVEMHVMEHGLLMLEGGGIYRLDDAWYPVRAGDFIWMGAYCPQWFGALGKSAAKYLIYKNWR